MSLLLAEEEQYEDIKKIPLVDRVPFLEMIPYDSTVPYIDTLHDSPSLRTMKTHLPFRFISRWIKEDKLRTIVTTRNPKDVIVSYYHFYQIVSCK